MPDFPDEYLPPVTSSLFHFVEAAALIVEQDPYPGALQQFMLAGLLAADAEDPSDEVSQRSRSPDLSWVRTFINAREGLAPPTNPTVVGDFDSVIGITQRLPFAKAISWHIIPLFKETLTKNTHITRKISVGRANKRVGLHRIPNYMVLKFDTRHQGRVFLPGFYTPNESPAIPLDVFPMIYDRAVLPAIKACSVQLASAWPLNYRLAERLSRGEHGHISPVARDIPPDLVQQFAHEFLTRLQNLGPKFKDAFFEIEAKGVKGTSIHNPSNARARRAALRRVLDPLIITAIPDEELATDWFVDVALEVHEPGHCLVWTTEGHSRIIQHTLPSLSLDQARSLTGSSHFILDPTAHLTSFAGFRLEPGKLGSHDYVTYLNVYTTDKAATYQLNHGIYRRRRCTDLLPKNIGQLLDDIDQISETMSICGGAQGATQDGAARLEARVNIAFAEVTLARMPRRVIEDCIIAVPSVTWWTFKFFRMVAIYRVFSELSRTPPEARAWIPSMMLGASCLYMFNALIYRPSDDRAETALADQCALWVYPTVDPADPANVDAYLIEEPTMVPCTTARGLYFLSAIVRDEGHHYLRLPRARLMDRGLLARLYAFSNLADVSKALGAGAFGLSAHSTSHKARTSNRKVTVPVAAFQSQPRHHDFELAAQGIQPHPLLAMTGEDVAMDRFQDDDVEETLDHAFSKIWAQFPSDIIQCSPNHKTRTKPAYIHLSQEEREDVTIDLFKSFSLPFDAVYIRTCQDIAQWRDLFFDKFFPPPGAALSANLQNFRNCTYLNAYSLELARLRPRAVQQVRSALWEQFNQLRWLPHAESDRMWPTRPRAATRLWQAFPANITGPAANVVVNPRFYSGSNCISLVNLAPPGSQTMADEDEAFAEVYNRVQVRQSNPDSDRSFLQDGSRLLDSIRQEREDSSQPPPPRMEEEESSPPPPRREEEESSPPPIDIAHVVPSRVRPPPLAREEEESSPAPSSPEVPRGRVSEVPSFAHFLQGLKRSAPSEFSNSSIFSARNVRPRQTQKSSLASASQRRKSLTIANDDMGKFNPIPSDDDDDDTGEFKPMPYEEEDEDDDDTGEFKPMPYDKEEEDEDDDTGEFKPMPYDEEEDEDDDTGEFKPMPYDKEEEDEDDDTGEFKPMP